MHPHPYVVVASPGRLRVAGEVDLAVSAALLDAIISAGSTGGTPDLVVDLTEVTFLDSTGINALVEARNRLAAEDIRLRIENPTPFVAHVLDVVGVADHLGLQRLTAVD